MKDYQEKTYWVIDILPKQVPANGQGQYFKIEEFFLKEPQYSVIRKKFCSLLLKLNCYYDIAVLNTHDEWIDNPPPESVEEWLSSGEAVYVMLKSGAGEDNCAPFGSGEDNCDPKEAIIIYSGDDHYLTLYNPNENLLELVSSLANAEGLFIWKHENSE